VPGAHGRDLDLDRLRSIVAHPDHGGELLPLESAPALGLDRSRHVRLLGEHESGAAEHQERHRDQRELGPAGGERRNQTGAGQSEHGRRLVIRDAGQRLIEMTDRHAGRLRSELAGRVAEAVHDYRHELTAAVDEAVDAIRAAIERATVERRRGEQHARGRLDQLAGIEQRCTQLSTDLDRWIAGPSPTRKDGP